MTYNSLHLLFYCQIQQIFNNTFLVSMGQPTNVLAEAISSKFIVGFIIVQLGLLEIHNLFLSSICISPTSLSSPVRKAKTNKQEAHWALMCSHEPP